MLTPSIHRFLNYELSLEFRLLGRNEHCPPGLYLFPMNSSERSWQGVYFIPPPSPYQRAILKFILSFPETYPAHPPLIQFDSFVFHPLIHPTTNTLKFIGPLETWDPQVHRVIHVVWYLHYCFSNPCLLHLRTSQISNPESFELLKLAPEAFQEKVQATVHASLQNEKLYENHRDRESIVFSELLPSEFEQVRDLMLSTIQASSQLTRSPQSNI